MRPFDSFATVAATFFASVFMLALVLLAPGLVLASEPAASRQSTPSQTLAPPALVPPALPDLRATLDDGDEVATLDAVHIALSQVGDGGTYVWQRLHGRLSAVLQPTQSFKDHTGQVCRHLLIRLTSGLTTRQTEGIACRLANGRWQLDG